MNALYYLFGITLFVSPLTGFKLAGYVTREKLFSAALILSVLALIGLFYYTAYTPRLGYFDFIIFAMGYLAFCIFIPGVYKNFKYAFARIASIVGFAVMGLGFIAGLAGLLLFLLMKVV